MLYTTALADTHRVSISRSITHPFIEERKYVYYKYTRNTSIFM